MHPQQLVIPGIGGGAPQLPQHLLVGKHPPGVPPQQRQDLELAGGKTGILPGQVRPVLIVIDDQLPDDIAPLLHFLAAAGPAGVAQRRADACQQFHRAERLGEVIIGAEIQRFGLVVLGDAGGNDDDGHAAPAADAFDDADTVHIRQTEIQQDAVGTMGGNERQRSTAISRGDDIIPGGGKGAFQVAADAGIILNDQDLITMLHRGPPRCHFRRAATA